ncbi:MAG: lamin tail domain-containing protein [Bacteroidetes bacterium]|nr:lamin tail domain-containing protein [Bacteroidota bacterium]
MHHLIFLALAGVMILGWIPLRAQISLTTSTYSQDFNTLANTGTSNVVPSGWAFSESGTSANNDGLYTAGTGSLAAGDTYSFGSSGSTERAFGGLLSGTLTPTIGASFQNNAGGTIISLAINYYGEQWRLGALGRIDRLDFQYSTDATSLTTGTWTDFNTLDFIAPVQTGTVGALDGNAAGNKIGITGTITGLSIANSATFWIRWNDYNATGADDGLGVDDFSITASTTCDITVTGFSPSIGPVGTTVAITGTNFTGGTTVYFNGIQSTTVTYSSSTLIYATVPSGATTGPITVVSSLCSVNSASIFTVVGVSCIAPTDLYISEYVEGLSNNKAIEVANFTGATIDLSNYYIDIYSNGSPTVTTSIQLSNTNLPTNQVWVLAHSSGTGTLLLVANQTSGVLSFNGNDAVVLRKGASTLNHIDIFGNIGCDPGTSWSSGAYQTVDQTLVRNSDVYIGITTNPVGGGCPFPTLTTQWTQYPVDDFTHLGSHTTIYSTPPPTITSQPSDASVCDGATAVLTVGATGATTYQWKYFDGANWVNVVDEAGKYSGAQTSQLTITGQMALNGTQYYCEVHSAADCYVASKVATLTVHAAAATSPIYHN